MQAGIVLFESTLLHHQHHHRPSQQPLRVFGDYVQGAHQPMQIQEQNQCVFGNQVGQQMMGH
jgi:hypothetical protein